MKINSGPYSDQKKANALVRVFRELITNKIKTNQLRVAYMAALHMESYLENLYFKNSQL